MNMLKLLAYMLLLTAQLHSGTTIEKVPQTCIALRNYCLTAI
jgi:hypothetical protein